MKSPLIITGAVLAVTTLTGGAYYARSGGSSTEIVTKTVSRGDIVQTISATGTLQALTTVQVGTQVSGTVEALYADFNSIVHKGQVIARLDPSLFQSQVEQARANLVGAQADVERLRVGLEDARTKAARAQELWDKKLIPQTDLETAQVTTRSAEAQLRSAEAQVTQARAALNQTQVSLDKIVITAPIDGVVIARNVDVGQTVASSLQAPTLFQIAADLTKMQVSASISEADVGNVQTGQPVSFHVDAYPNQTFSGTVSQVRLNPVVEQNVVTYAGMIDVSNPDMKLKPGMTATLTIETARRDNVLRVPNAALQFRPTTAQLAALGQNPTGTPQQPARTARATASAGGRLWTDQGGRYASVKVGVGITDGAYTELQTTDVQEGAKVVTSVLETGTGSQASSAGSGTRSGTAGPLAGLQSGPGFPGGRR